MRNYPSSLITHHTSLITRFRVWLAFVRRDKLFAAQQPPNPITVPTLHLVSGLPASGKTTYALRLRDETKGILFCLDRWLITAFGKYSIATVGQDEHTRRVLACRELIRESAAEFLKRSVDVILDDGFFYREHRMQHARFAAEVDADATIHFINTPMDLVRERLERRNADLPRYNFHIDPSTLDTFLAMYERPSRDEGARVVVVGDRVHA